MDMLVCASFVKWHLVGAENNDNILILNGKEYRPWSL
jgi:hypothetical protein